MFIQTLIPMLKLDIGILEGYVIGRLLSSVYKTLEMPIKTRKCCNFRSCVVMTTTQDLTLLTQTDTLVSEVAL